jgi:tRNA(Arg) A34 adenosine deaminase TadA
MAGGVIPRRASPNLRGKLACRLSPIGVKYGEVSLYALSPIDNYEAAAHRFNRPVEHLSSIDPAELMQLAIDRCRQGLAAGQSPFGCAIARGGKVLSASHNTVLLTTDITAHAEVNALREACRQTGQILLERAIVATTCEPCPMCMAALHWARVDTVYYGASIADAATAGFNELQLPAAELLRLGGSKLNLIPGLLTEECKQLFAEWNANPNRKVY